MAFETFFFLTVLIHSKYTLRKPVSKIVGSLAASRSEFPGMILRACIARGLKAWTSSTRSKKPSEALGSHRLFIYLGKLCACVRMAGRGTFNALGKREQCFGVMTAPMVEL